MPIYEYQCRTCDEIFEELVLRKSDEDELACPRCGEPHPPRILSATVSRSSGSGGGAAACVPRGGFS